MRDSRYNIRHLFGSLCVLSNFGVLARLHVGRRYCRIPPAMVPSDSNLVLSRFPSVEWLWICTNPHNKGFRFPVLFDFGFIVCLHVVDTPSVLVPSNSNRVFLSRVSSK